MIIKCNIFLLDKDILEQQEALGLKNASREDYDTPCPFSFDTKEVISLMATLDEDKIPKPTSVIGLRNGFEFEINIPYKEAHDLIWGEGIKTFVYKTK